MIKDIGGIFISILFLFLIFNPFIISAGELHTWIDKKGVTNITDQPPENPVKIIGKETYKLDSPEEIQRYEKKQKATQQQNEVQRQYNQDRAASKKRAAAYRDQQKEQTKQRGIEREKAATERMEDLKAEKERLQAVENRNWNEVRRLRLKDDQRRIDRDINK